MMMMMMVMVVVMMIYDAADLPTPYVGKSQ